MTAEFIANVPCVWPNMNTLIPYGGTPLYEQMSRQGRLLPTLPLTFYCSPYLSFVPLHYDPVTFYDLLVQLFEQAYTSRLTMRRVWHSAGTALKIGRFAQSVAVRRDIVEMRQIRDAMKADAGLRAFHEGRDTAVPKLYRSYLRKRLGNFSELLSDKDLRPVAPSPLALPPRDRRVAAAARALAGAVS